MLRYQKNAKNALYADAKRAYPNECCGVLLGKQNIITQVISTQNQADEITKNRHFSINPLQMWRIEQRAAQQGLDVIGIYHSHPDCEALASQEDIKHMIIGYAYVIVSVYHGECRQIRSFEKLRPDDKVVKEHVLLCLETNEA